MFPDRNFHFFAALTEYHRRTNSSMGQGDVRRVPIVRQLGRGERPPVPKLKAAKDELWQPFPLYQKCDFNLFSDFIIAKCKSEYNL